LLNLLDPKSLKTMARVLTLGRPRAMR